MTVDPKDKVSLEGIAERTPKLDDAKEPRSETPESADGHSEYLTREEIYDVLAEFEGSKADSARFVKIARIMCRSYGLDEWEAEDLISETMTAFLEGRRQWPRENEKRAVFRRNMDWIARDEGRRIGRSGGSKPEISPDLPDHQPTPAQIAEASSTLRAVYNSLNDDPIGQEILDGWYQGMSPGELQGKLKLNETEYDTKVRKIRRRLDKLASKADKKGGKR